MAIRKPIVSKLNKHSPLSVGDNLDLGGTKLTGLENGTDATDAVNFSQISGLGGANSQSVRAYFSATLPAQAISNYANPTMVKGAFATLTNNTTKEQKVYVINKNLEIDVTNFNNINPLYINIYDSATGNLIDRIFVSSPSNSINEPYISSTGKKILRVMPYSFDSTVFAPYPLFSLAPNTSITLDLKIYTSTGVGVVSSSFKIAGNVEFLRIW